MTLEPSSSFSLLASLALDLWFYAVRFLQMRPNEMFTALSSKDGSGPTEDGPHRTLPPTPMADTARGFPPAAS
jgi:hypothetical protein